MSIDRQLREIVSAEVEPMRSLLEQQQALLERLLDLSLLGGGAVVAQRTLVEGLERRPAPNTLVKWRREGVIPRGEKKRGQVYYTVAEAIEFQQACRVRLGDGPRRVG